ncbi:MAG TPA: NADH-quinone oxidoreductase subunit C [Methylomirabilota bacterium]|jgi:NADH-quinone oxidoreductase subunit C|nr:NADH-quinone oxidoreductase subunit C [Methylomirabilota bacterium]
MAETNLLANLETAFPGKILESSILHGDETIIVAREDAPAIFTTLRNAPEFAFELLVDLTVVDFFGKEPRFEVVYHLKSLSVGHRLRVKIRVTEDDPVVPTVSSIWKSGNWLEREAWDMFGVRFSGHPDLRRILMYEEFRGHPLRKDYPVDKRQPLVEERDPVNDPWPRR